MVAANYRAASLLSRLVPSSGPSAGTLLFSQTRAVSFLSASHPFLPGKAQSQRPVTSPRVATWLFSKKRMIIPRAQGLFAAVAGRQGAGQYLLKQKVGL